MRSLFVLAFASCILICQHVLSQQNNLLVGYWSFDAIDGKVVKDLSGNGNHGNINGDTRVVKGKVGKALEFAPGAYVEIADSKSLKDMKEYTVGMWVNMNNLSADWNHLFEKDGSYGITINSASKDFRYTPNSSKVWLESKFKVETGVWYYVTMVATDSAISFYVNGEKTSEAKEPIVYTNNPVTIAHGPTSYKVDGIIDEVKLWSVALKQSEIVTAMEGSMMICQQGKQLPTFWGYLKTH